MGRQRLTLIGLLVLGFVLGVLLAPMVAPSAAAAVDEEVAHNQALRAQSMELALEYAKLTSAPTLKRVGENAIKIQNYIKDATPIPD